MTGRVLVVSHPAVLAVNQDTYAALVGRGWDVQMVVPSSWSHGYSDAPFAPERLEALEGRLHPVPVLGRGRAQRHVYLRRIGRLLDRLRPDVVFLEAESFSLAAGQWAGPLRRRSIPFGVQQAENLERPLPAIAHAIDRVVLSRAAFVASRSPAAADRARRRRPGVATPLVAHTFRGWADVGAPPGDPEVLHLGFAGRLVPEKGLDDLLDAMQLMDAGSRLTCFGDGPEREHLLARSTATRPVEVRTGLRHEDMGSAYGGIDVLVLPSRTTPTWSEQFGRVLIEAMACGRPVVAADSGEIPWVVQSTGGGVLYPEGDVGALARTLDRLARDPSIRRTLGEQGRRGAEEHFGLGAVTTSLADALMAAHDGRGGRG